MRAILIRRDGFRKEMKLDSVKTSIAMVNRNFKFRIVEDPSEALTDAPEIDTYFLERSYHDEFDNKVLIYKEQ